MGLAKLRNGVRLEGGARYRALAGLPERCGRCKYRVSVATLLLTSSALSVFVARTPTYDCIGELCRPSSG